ncbi:MAG: substrate-binding domain-containing protein [Desulfobacterales bacterium]|nr:substrate-binding domain-containing protein [Desulfobacterales bacterium]
MSRCENCSRREFLNKTVTALGLAAASGLCVPTGLLASGKDSLGVDITGRCVFNSIVVTHENQEGLPNPYQNETPFAFTMNDDCSGLEHGIQSVRDGNVDIATLLRPLTENEKTELEEVPLDRMAYAVVVNKKNPVDDLTLEQVLKIFAGQITNWQEVGGPDMEILLYQQKCGASFEHQMEKLLAQAGIVKDRERLEDATLFVEVTDNQLEKIAEHEMAVAIVPRMFFDDNSRHLKVDGIRPSRASEKDKTYPLCAQLSLVTRKSPSAAARKFIAHVNGPHGREIMEKGYEMNWLANGF